MLKIEEILELQEKLIIIYKYISQKRLLNAFFYSGLEDQIPSRDLSSNPLVKKVVEMEESEKMLRDSILELEGMLPSNFKDDYNSDEFDNEFQYILFKNDLESLCKKYGLKDSDEVEKLDIGALLELIE